ncbi:MAG: four helix bundle protein [bacterium]|nr:four helix bundle protein [bacterium]
MDQFRFLNWKVYKDSKLLLSLILDIVKKLPKEYRYELSNQIIRSTFSIVLNIAEGAGKTSDKELNRFIEIALGSVSETLAGLDVFRDNALITVKEFDNCFRILTEISSQLGGFKKKFNK